MPFWNGYLPKLHYLSAENRLMASVDFNTIAGVVRLLPPVCLSYVGTGFAAGVLGAKVGMSPAEVGLLSLLMFVGSSQFIFAELITIAPVTLVVTIFLVNLRHLLYSSSLALQLKKIGIGKRVLIGSQLTDVSFSIASTYIRQPLTSAQGMLTLNMSIYSCWFVGSITGAIVGGVASEQLELIAIDFALAGVFGTLLMMQIAAATIKKPIIIVAVLSAGLLICLELIYPHPFNLIIAACIAATIGVVKFGMPGAKAKQP